MLKGAQKRMIIVRTGDSRYFDEAYFVLRREVGAKSSSRTDMLREANRILEEGGVAPRSRRRLFWGCVGIFVLGFVVGGGLSALVLTLVF